MADDGLVEFLTARLDEREEAANWASTSVAANEQWRLLKRSTVLLGPSLALEVSERAVAHIKLNDPAFVLADIAAKRRIVEAYLDARSRRDILQSEEARAVEDERQRQRRRAEAARCRGLEIAVEAFAAPFSGHRDYRQEWTP